MGLTLKSFSTIILIFFVLKISFEGDRIEVVGQKLVTRGIMKHLLNVFILLVIIFNASCNWYIFKKSKYSVTNRPEICDKVFDGNPVNSKKLEGYSVEELLILQECGLAYHPQYQLQGYIADQDEYPVPSLIRHLKTDPNGDFHYYLILDFVALTESEKHSKKLLSDKDLILTEISKAISKMQNEELKRISKEEFQKIKNFYDR